jgi:hypothetical protein
MLSFDKPVYIALCGWPKTGKSEIQKVLEQRYGAISVDDGEPMRKFAIEHLGATVDDVYTQAGKARTVTLPGGKTMTWREFLGEFGNRIEDLLGANAIPEIAVRKHTVPGQIYAFGSVRREQGIVYKAAGGIVVEVANKFLPASPHEFDRYAKELIDFTIENHVRVEDRGPETLAALERSTMALFDRLLPLKKQAA